jgi:hypothetical protein
MAKTPKDNPVLNKVLDEALENLKPATKSQMDNAEKIKDEFAKIMKKVSEKRGKPVDMRKMQINEAGVITYPDIWMDWAAELGKGDITSKISKHNTSVFDQIDGLGTQYQQSYAGAPTKGEAPMHHGTGAPKVYKAFRTKNFSGRHTNTTTNPRTSMAFTDSAVLRSNIAKEAKDPAQYQENYEYWKTPLGQHNLTDPSGLPFDENYGTPPPAEKPRSIPVEAQQHGPQEDRLWDFRKPEDVDNVLSHMETPTMFEVRAYHSDEPHQALVEGELELEDLVKNVNEYGDMEILDKTKLRQQILDGNYYGIENEAVTRAAKKAGYEGGFVVEAPMSQRDEFTPDNMKTVNEMWYNPQQLRSPWAAKDPAKRHSRNLLASAVPVVTAVGVGGAALSSSDPAYAGQGLVTGFDEVIDAGLRAAGSSTAHGIKTETPGNINNAVKEAEANSGPRKKSALSRIIPTIW